MIFQSPYQPVLVCDSIVFFSGYSNLLTQEFWDLNLKNYYFVKTTFVSL